jgi:hypothetical protein
MREWVVNGLCLSCEVKFMGAKVHIPSETAVFYKALLGIGQR